MMQRSHRHACPRRQLTNLQEFMIHVSRLEPDVTSGARGISRDQRGGTEAFLCVSVLCGYYPRPISDETYEGTLVDRLLLRVIDDDDWNGMCAFFQLQSEFLNRLEIRNTARIYSRSGADLSTSRKRGAGCPHHGKVVPIL